MSRIIELELSEKRKKALLLNDAYPALLLIYTGLDTILSGGNVSLSIGNLAIGAVSLVFALHEWRSLGRNIHHRIQWFDVMSGVMMLTDAVTMYKPWKGFQPAWFYAAIAVFIILRGFSVIKTIGIRRLTITEEGFSIRTHFHSVLRCRWDEVKTISLLDHSLVVETTHGTRSFSLRRVANKEELLAALLAAPEYHSLPVPSGVSKVPSGVPT